MICTGRTNILLFAGSRCYEVKVTKLQVQMGADGTNDDVKAKVTRARAHTHAKGSLEKL